MPQTRAEVTLAGDWAYTLGGEPFILAEEGTDDKIILLGTQSNLHHLAEAECLYMDGTFQTCPRLFYQIFSIHIDGERGSPETWSRADPFVSSFRL